MFDFLSPFAGDPSFSDISAAPLFELNPLDYYLQESYSNSSTNITTKNIEKKDSESLKKELELFLKELFEDELVSFSLIENKYITKLCYHCLGKGTVPSRRGSTLLCKKCFGKQYICVAIKNENETSIDVLLTFKEPEEFVTFSFPLDGF